MRQSPAEPGSHETRCWRGQSRANPSPNSKFPTNRGENREFSRFPGLQPPVIFKNRRRIKRLHHGYPNHRTGNFLKHNREFALATDQGGGHRSVRPIAPLAAWFKAKPYHPCRLVSAEFRGFSDKDPSQVAGSPETWRQKSEIPPRPIERPRVDGPRPGAGLPNEDGWAKDGRLGRRLVLGKPLAEQQ